MRLNRFPALHSKNVRIEEKKNKWTPQNVITVWKLIETIIKSIQMIVLVTILYLLWFNFWYNLVLFFVQLFGNITNIAKCNILYHACHGKFLFLGTLNPFNPNAWYKRFSFN